MRSNPFYAMSASAMLLGCWLLGEALELEAGKLSGLLVLVLVLQLYELLLTGLGAHLVRSGRAPRDGVIVLALGSVFLMNATGLSSECVTIDRRAGALVTLALVALGWLKLWWVRRQAPDLLSTRVAVILGAHSTAALAIPLAAMELAAARVLSPAVVYGFWWLASALPLARKQLSDATVADAGSATRAHAAWTWTPFALVVYQLWSAGYVHTLDFEWAFTAPVLLGLTITVDEKKRMVRYVLPALAVGFASTLDPVLGRVLGSSVQPVHLAMIATGLVWLYLAWRDRDRWLAAISIGGAAVILAGSPALRLVQWIARVLWQSAPRDSYGWGALTVISAFALLAIGAYRSLRGDGGGLRGSGGASRRRAGEAPAEY